LLNLKKDDGTAYIYQTQPVLIKKKKVLFANKTIYKDEEEEERKPKEVKKTIKLIKKNQDKQDLLLQKRRYKDFHLEHVNRKIFLLQYVRLVTLKKISNFLKITRKKKMKRN